MKTGGQVLIGIAVAALLAGCSAQSIPSERVGAETRGVDPAIPSSYDGTTSQDEFFIVGLKRKWSGAVPENGELAALADPACAALRAGKELTVPGDPKFKRANAELAITYAKVIYCPSD